MNKTKIEWADAVWNPITGCTPISEGCDHCYAKRMATRLKGRYGYPADDPFRVTFHPDRLKDPLRLKKPRRIFVGSMTDLFHPDIKLEWLGKMLYIADKCPQHTFLFLTKRPEMIARHLFAERTNCWLGVTCENQARADERIPILLQIPAAVRFVSIEPMIEHVYLDQYMIPPLSLPLNIPCKSIPLLDWAICGGETGPGARPAKAEWFMPIIDQCRAASVPVFIKKAPDSVPIIREFPKQN